MERHEGSALRVFTSSERCANHLKINESGAVGKLVRKIEMSGPQAGMLVKVVQTGGVKVGELVKKIHMHETKVGKVWRSVTVGQEEYLKPEQDAMLAEAGEEDGFIKFDDITGKEQPWQAVKRARDKELKYLRELGVCEKVP